MNVPHPFSALLISAAPEAILIFASVIILSIHSSRHLDKLSPLGSFSHLLALSGCFLSLIPAGFYYYILTQIQGGKWIEHSGFRIDGTLLLIKIALIVLAVFALILSREEQADSAPASSSVHHFGNAGSPGFILLSTAALMIFCSSASLGTSFLGLEFAGLFWGLSRVCRGGAQPEPPPAFSFFIPWLFSSSLILLGYSFLYSAGGSTVLREITPLMLREHKPLWILALAMIFTGLVFRFGFLPLRLSKPRLGNRFSPSVLAFYTGAILWGSFWILGILLSTGSSAGAGTDSPPGTPIVWRIFIALAGAFLMTWGSLAALFQRSLCRLTLYLALVQMGFLTIGLSFNDLQALPTLAFYGLFHAVSLMGICAFSSILIRAAGSDRIESLQSLGRNRPLLGICLVIFLLSWLGLPPLAGFWVKLKIFTLLFKLSAPGLLLPLFLTAAALWATLLTFWPIYKVIKRLYRAPDSTPEEAFRLLSFQPQTATQAVIILLALITLAAGLWGAYTLNQNLFPLTYLRP